MVKMALCRYRITAERLYHTLLYSCKKANTLTTYLQDFSRSTVCTWIQAH